MGEIVGVIKEILPLSAADGRARLHEILQPG